MKEKTHLYFVSGLAANPSIFENIQLDKDKFELHFIEWLVPNGKNESLEYYAERMSVFVKHKNAILIGVSFGGVMVQEMKKYCNPKKIIIISSIKNKFEMPARMRLAQKTGFHKAFPTNVLSNIEKYEKYAFTTVLKERLQLYKKYLSMNDKVYLPWSIDTLVNWRREETDTEIIHIHGTNDFVFPLQNISNAILVENGTHIMILNKAKEISQLIAAQIQLA